jgi:hypothetical protein
VREGSSGASLHGGARRRCSRRVSRVLVLPATGEADETLGMNEKRKHFKSGGYSREFTPHGDSGKRYLLDKIPAGLWADVKSKCKREGISIRALLLSLLRDWVSR